MAESKKKSSIGKYYEDKPLLFYKFFPRVYVIFEGALIQSQLIFCMSSSSLIYIGRLVY